MNDIGFIQLKKTKLREREPPKSPRTQCQVQNDTQIRKNQKVVKNDNNELIVENFAEKEKQPIIEKPKINLTNCLSCKRNSWTKLTHGCF